MQSDTHCRRARRHRSLAGAAVLLSAAIIVPTADDVKPGWTRAITSADDVAGVVGTAVGVRPTSDADAAAQRYGASELRSAEERRAVERSARLAQLRATFVDGPVLVLPRTGELDVSVVTTGMTPLPGVGTVAPTTRAAGAWGFSSPTWP